MTMDISNFYLNSPLPRPEFIRIKLSDTPEEIIIEYMLREKSHLQLINLHYGNKGNVRTPTGRTRCKQAP